MVAASDFNAAIQVLNQLTAPHSPARPLDVRFSAQYGSQNPAVTALKILHQVRTEGQETQRAQLSYDKIVALNALLAKHSFSCEAQARLGVNGGGELKEWQGVQIELPQTRFEKMLDLSLRVPRALISILIEIGVFPCVRLLQLISFAHVSFDPVHPKRDQTPILLLHGSRSFEAVWMLGCQFLKKERYGSVFSLNYDGWTSCQGIDDYAGGKIRQKILEIQNLTGQSRVILIGHSMGGMIAGYYAEYCAHKDGIAVEHVVSIASPWRGAPLLRCLPEAYKSKRYSQMSEDSPFRKELVDRVLLSERSGKRRYYNVGSTTDLKVPAPYSHVTEHPKRQRVFSYLDHDGLVFSPRVWLQVCAWLDGMYAASSPVASRRSAPQASRQFLPC